MVFLSCCLETEHHTVAQVGHKPMALNLPCLQNSRITDMHCHASLATLNSLHHSHCYLGVHLTLQIPPEYFFLFVHISIFSVTCFLGLSGFTLSLSRISPLLGNFRVEHLTPCEAVCFCSWCYFLSHCFPFHFLIDFEGSKQKQ